MLIIIATKYWYSLVIDWYTKLMVKIYWVSNNKCIKQK